MLLVFVSIHGFLTIIVGTTFKILDLYESLKRDCVVKKWVIVSTHHPKPWNLRFKDLESVLFYFNLLY